MKRSFKALLATVLYIGFTNLYAQENIASDRPGQAFSPLTVGKSTGQIQTGLNFSQTTFSDRPLDLNFNIVSQFLDFRYGVAKSLEVHASLGYSFQNADVLEGIEINEESVSGFSNLALGARYNLTNPRNSKLPALGVRANLVLPVSDDFNNDTYFDLMFLHSQEIFGGFGLSTNLGFTWNPSLANEGTPGVLYVINLGHQIGRTDVSAFIEWYGNYSDARGEFSDSFENRLDGGFAWLVSSDLQLDISGGYGKNGSVQDWFIDAGLSFRFKAK